MTGQAIYVLNRSKHISVLKEKGKIELSEKKRQFYIFNEEKNVEGKRERKEGIDEIKKSVIIFKGNNRRYR